MESPCKSFILDSALLDQFIIHFSTSSGENLLMNVEVYYILAFRYDGNLSVILAHIMACNAQDPCRSSFDA